MAFLVLTDSSQLTSDSQNLGMYLNVDCQLDETHLNKDLVDFGGELQQDGINGVRKRLAELPKEWTVVQLTCGFNPLRRFGDPNQIQQTTTLHITRLESEPYCVTVNLPANVGLFEELSNIIAHHKTQLQEFIHCPTKYWKAREEKNMRMNAIVRQLENAWMKEWRCLLAGKLVNDELSRKVESAVKEHLLKTSQGKSVEDSTAGGDQVNYRRASQILFQVVLAAAKLTFFEVKKIVASCMGVNIKSEECNTLAEEIININKSITELETAKRHPLIIILDDQLEQFPWEMISLLSGHPVVRAYSLHMLHALFKVHEKDIKNGHVVSTNPELGNYIVNPDQNLNSMEERIKMSLVPRTPKWKGIFGVKPTSQQFKTALKDYDIFFYSGHGCGTKYLLGEDIQKIRVQAASLLFGCNSIGLTSLGRLVENWGTTQSYLIGCSPCIVGALWTVTDQDTDRFALNMLHHWLPPTEEMKKRMALVEPKEKRPLRNGKKNREILYRAFAQ
uniref:separase n=1 Tax=Timema shepardi TaxID=629360 RepID=A0A7R9B2D7_TIMSH|nr:unnamed protein product [Timema shepardi]